MPNVTPDPHEEGQLDDFEPVPAAFVVFKGDDRPMPVLTAFKTIAKQLRRTDSAALAVMLMSATDAVIPREHVAFVTKGERQPSRPGARSEASVAA